MHYHTRLAIANPVFCWEVMLTPYFQTMITAVSAVILQPVRSFPRNVRFYLLAGALVGFVYDGGVYSVLFNLYLLRLNYGPQLIGQINSAGMIAFAISALPAGALGQRFGSRRMIILGALVMLAGSLLLPVAEAFAGSGRLTCIYMAYLLLNMGMAPFFVNGAPFLVEAAEKSDRNNIFALQSATLGIAAFVGSLSAGLLPKFFAWLLNSTLSASTPYRYTLLIAAVALWPCLWAVRQTKQPIAPAHSPSSKPILPPPQPERRRIAFTLVQLVIILTIIRLLIVASTAVRATFFNIYLDAGLHISTAQIGNLMAVGRLTAVAAALCTPLLAKRFGNAPVAVVACICAALMLLLPAFSTHPWVAALGYIGETAFTSIRWPAFVVYLMAVTPAKWRGTISGAGEMAAGLSFALVGLIGGWLIERRGYSSVFWLGTGMTLAGALLFMLFLRTQQTITAKTIPTELL